MLDLDSKLQELKRFITEKGKNGVVVAFSGGVDSATLAALTHEVLGEKAVAVTAQSATYTHQELTDAKQIAREIGIKLHIIHTDELQNPNFSRNPENRCYFCKKELLQKLAAFSQDLGFSAVFEGTNASDLSDHRPGFRATQEVQGVFSPWITCGFSKDEIRQVAKAKGLSVHDKPALACLASRIPFNQEITAEKLLRVQEAEDTIKKMVGVKQVRVRDHNGLARIEVARDERALFFGADVLDRVALALKGLGFKFVTFDLEGYRSGSMLKTLE